MDMDIMPDIMQTVIKNVRSKGPRRDRSTDLAGVYTITCLTCTLIYVSTSLSTQSLHPTRQTSTFGMG